MNWPNFLRKKLTFERLKNMGFVIYDHFPNTPSFNQDATLRIKNNGFINEIKLLRNVSSKHAWSLSWEHQMGHRVFQYKDELLPLINVFKTKFSKPA